MNMKDDIKNLFLVYLYGYEPPKWIIDYDLSEYMKTTILYYDANCIDYKDLIRYRIPVNIGMKLYYNKELMEKYFGYSESIYNESSSNIAVYTKTPVIINEKKYDVNVINVIAPALDSYNQYDYKRIKEKIGLNINLTNEKIYELMLEKCFIKIKECFKNFDILVMSGFGLGSFSILCKELDIDCKNIYKKFLIKYFWKSKKKIYLNHLNDLDCPQKDNFIYINEDINYVISKFLTNKLDKVLFVNAWDPYSIVGNGNERDNSLDGYFGRISAMSVLCWSITNPNIKYIECL